MSRSLSRRARISKAIMAGTTAMAKAPRRGSEKGGAGGPGEAEDSGTEGGGGGNAKNPPPPVPSHDHRYQQDQQRRPGAERWHRLTQRIGRRLIGEEPGTACHRV